MYRVSLSPRANTQDLARGAFRLLYTPGPSPTVPGAAALDVQASAFHVRTGTCPECSRRVGVSSPVSLAGGGLAREEAQPGQVLGETR